MVKGTWHMNMVNNLINPFANYAMSQGAFRAQKFGDLWRGV